LFPSIEGTVVYPLLDNNLRIMGENIGCCRDVVIKFREILPAFLSGYYVAKNSHGTVLDNRFDYQYLQDYNEISMSHTDLSKVT
jgi:hypothetical protein